ncbi:hypothetical protein JYU34_017373 [Plutella xylostella]|uniref:Methionine-rich storage protein n=2 Tax=Plutella xylostella TaxID=51655 RepID=A0ABQ7Q191_PLUXY|nr:hypothetical protein JYU34_017373 [Plutella xylostella]
MIADGKHQSLRIRLSMKFLLLAAALVASASALVMNDDKIKMLIGKEHLDNLDIKTKEMLMMRLLNHMMQPTMYRDIKDCAREFVLEDHLDKFIKPDVVRFFMDTYKMGMLPRGEVFVHTSRKQMEQAITVVKMLYFAKDFDTFFRTCCWLRDRVNEGMFVYSVTVAVMHRDDCKGIILPAPYEICPNFFVNSDVIHKAYMMKMKKGMIDPMLLDYYNIKLTDKNVAIIDSRKGVRHTLTDEDRLAYFREDIDLNTYFYYLHMDYPSWMITEKMDKERRGEVMMYSFQQLLARYTLERLSHEMCNIKPLMLSKTLKTGYWPKIRLTNGEEMPVRMNHKVLLTEDKVDIKRRIDDIERMIRDAILTGKLEMRDGTVLKIKKPEDIETLCRLILGTLHMKDDAKVYHLMTLLKKMITYNKYNVNTYTYIPTALDMVQTCLRDPVFWMLMKRMTDNVVLFKKLLPAYTRDELDFPGVKVENFMTDKLVTFFDEMDMDITNALYLDEAEMKKEKSDMLMVARQRRLNHHNFKLTIDVVSDKTVDAVVRVFLGPKYDCMGKLMDINDKRLDMVEIDSFIYKLETGKNTIVRDSMEMHNMIGDRTWTRKMFDRSLVETLGSGDHTVTEAWWHRARTGFPHRMLLPMGRRGGMPMQMFVIVTPVVKDKLMNLVDMDTMRDRKVCRFTVCMDTLPLGFPFDREIRMAHFFTNNMKMTDVMIFHKDMDTMNGSKMMDMTHMVMKRDDLTYMDHDMLVKSRFRDAFLMDDDHMTRM